MSWQSRMGELHKIAKDLGLDPYETIFEEIPFDVMMEIAAYGLLTRFRHWSFGRDYKYYRLRGAMGFSKIYEVVLNSNPCWAFLLDTNKEIDNLSVIAHVYGHADFFKHNCMFKGSNTNMVNDSIAHAQRIDTYYDEHGMEVVEKFIDIALALERHIDPKKGLYRVPFPAKKITKKRVDTRHTPWDFLENETRSVTFETVETKIPPEPEKDVVWFLSRYANLQDWQRDILEIIREESFYFHPQVQTKVMNEGWASYWESEIMSRASITPEEQIDFMKTQAQVLYPGLSGGQMNPYYLGYQIFCDIKERWDLLYKEGKAKINGLEKMRQVMIEDNDYSFIHNYLTPELAAKMNLFTWNKACEHLPGQNKCVQCGKYVITSRELDHIKDSMTRHLYNYGGNTPGVQIVDWHDDGTLELQHTTSDIGELDRKEAEIVLGYINEIWKAPVKLRTINHDKQECFFEYDKEAGGFQVVLVE